MLKSACWCLIVFMYSFSCLASSNIHNRQLKYSIFLLGNIGLGVNCYDNLLLLKNTIDTTEGKSCVFFLGNSLFGNNYEFSDIEHKNPYLSDCLHIIKQYKSDVFFIPDNNEWNNGNTNAFFALGNIK